MLVLAVVAGLLLCGGGSYLWSTQNHDPARVASTHGKYAYTAPTGWDHRSPCHKPWDSLADDLSCAAPHGDTDYAVFVVSATTDIGDNGDLGTWATAQAARIADFKTCGTSQSTASKVRSAIVCLVGRYSSQAEGSLRVKVRGSVAVLEYCLRTEQPGMRDGCEFIWMHLDVTG
jgi:hypothetical protein